MPFALRDQLQSALADRYEIERELGRGGMATVFLARDRKHDRRVALKLLDPDLGAVLGAERFLSEIRVTANLHHPNLLPLFDSGSVDGMLYYVMPYIEGESLRARLDRERQLPIDEAVRIATAVAGALQYAHERGIIHRDLKPENILLQSGQPVVADFGIALAVSNAGGTRVTQTGLSLGTPQYMSPEQATGDRIIDARSDIYSLGAVTYEMLCGEPPHTGSTAQAIIARLMTEEPRPLTTVRHTVPEHVDEAVRCALEKLPADRFANARAFADALSGHASSAASTRAARVGGASRGAWTRHQRAIQLGGAAVVVVLGALAAAGWYRAVRAPSLPAVRFVIPSTTAQPIAEAGGNQVALSPDGRVLAYLVRRNGQRMLAIRPLDEVEPRIVPGTDGAADPRFSRDGQAIVIYATPEGVPGLYRVPVNGGTPIPLAQTQWEGLAWGNSDSVFFTFDDTLRMIAGAGAGVKIIATLDTAAGEIEMYDPYVFPGGKVLAYRATLRDSTTPHIALRHVDGSGRTLLPLRGLNVLAYLDGWMYYGRIDGTVAAVRLDLGSRRVSGEPVQVLDGVFVRSTGAAAAISPAGTLAYMQGRGNNVLRVLDSKGTTLRESVEQSSVSTPRWSPDGRQVALVVGPPSAVEKNDIWIHDVASGVSTRLTTTGGIRPAWSPDGRRVLYLRSRQDSADIFSIPADGSGREELVARGRFREAEFTPDGQRIVARVDRSASDRDIVLVDLRGDRTPRPLLATNFNELRGTVSPDGRWLAYQSDESGRYEIYVRPFDAAGGRVRVSIAGGLEPLWSRDGRSLFYRSANALIRARVTTTGGIPVVAARDSLFADRFFRASLGQRSYDVHPDGQQIAVATPRDEDRSITVVTDWLRQAREKLKRP